MNLTVLKSLLPSILFLSPFILAFTPLFAYAFTKGW